jgi:hypothetical protein
MGIVAQYRGVFTPISLTDNTVSNQKRLPDPGECRTKHPEHSFGLSVCLVKNPHGCEYAGRFHSSIFCRHPDKRGFEKTDRPDAP